MLPLATYRHGRNFAGKSVSTRHKAGPHRPRSHSTVDRTQCLAYRELAMHRNKRPIPLDQTAHEVIAGRGFLLWIAFYLVLTLAFLISNHPLANRVFASHHAGDRIPATGTAPDQNTKIPGMPLPIAGGS
jgi:hypothetical protein